MWSGTRTSALEEYEQVEVINGVGGGLYGPANPSGMFNFVTKRPTAERLAEIELGYEGNSVSTVHADVGGRAGRNKMFGYRTNLLLADGAGYVHESELRRQLAAGAGDMRVTDRTVIEGNFSYYNLFQHLYPSWFAYSPTTTPLSLPGSKSILRWTVLLPFAATVRGVLKPSLFYRAPARTSNFYVEYFDNPFDLEYAVAPSRHHRP